MKTIVGLCIVAFWISLGSAFSQNKSMTASFFNVYEQYREPTVSHQYLTRPEIAPLINSLEQVAGFEVKILGQSVEGRDISLIKWGQGPIKVLLWSQMHGDEPTATQALLDIFRFLKTSDEFDAWRNQLSEQVTLYFVPMLNPDGAERFTRRNAFQIDLNRDALRLQSPEARILKSLRDSLNPDFGFNLHDQGTLYSAGKTANQASISFLAPPFNEAREVNAVRKKAIQLIGLLNKEIQAYIPNHVGKYDDTFEPRAFGDNIQKWGTSTILIETGGYPNDPEKQFLRKINFTLLLTAFDAIAKNGYKKIKLDAYYQIPDNNRYLFDLVVRNALVEKQGIWYKSDIGVNFSRFHAKGEKDFRYRASIAELGDMSTFFGYEEFNAEGLKAVPGLTSADTLLSVDALDSLDCKAYWDKGITQVFVNQPEDQVFPSYIPYPMNVVWGEKAPNMEIRLGGSANFILQAENGKALFAIINGFLIEIEKGVTENWRGNGLGIR